MAITIGATASVYCDYGLLLMAQKRFPDAIQVFLLAIKLQDDGSGLGYGPEEKSVLDSNLQKEIDVNRSISLKPIVMAHYCLISCYQASNQMAKLNVTLKAFADVVKSLDDDPLSDRLLEYAQVISKQMSVVPVAPSIPIVPGMPIVSGMPGKTVVQVVEKPSETIILVTSSYSTNITLNDKGNIKRGGDRRSINQNNDTTPLITNKESKNDCCCVIL